VPGEVEADPGASGDLDLGALEVGETGVAE
jgi:hypothetical protein